MKELHQFELTGMKWLYQFRSPESDVFFRFMDYFDRPEFYILLFPLIWYGFSRKWGIRLFFWLIFNSICNYYFKEAFDQPRPFDLDPSLGLINVKYHGFPSGAAQSTLFLTAAFIQAWKTSKAWLFGIMYLFLVCFSRVYLGVHFPTDILGGLAIGSIVFLIYLNLTPQLEKWIAKKPSWLQLFFVLAIPILGYIALPSAFMARNCAAISSVGVGLILSKIFKISNPLPSLKNGFIATVSVIGIAFAGYMYFNLGIPGSTALLGVWLSFVLPCLLAFPKSLKKLQQA